MAHQRDNWFRLFRFGSFCALAVLALAGCQTAPPSEPDDPWGNVATPIPRTGVFTRVPIPTVDTALSGPVNPSAYYIRESDQIIVLLRGIPVETKIEDIVDDNGNITLDFLGNIHVVGKTASQLEKIIEKAYVDQKIYKQVTVSVVVPNVQTAQTYYIRGEVRQPGKFPLTSGITLNNAISTAGGYTDFANKKKVQLIRGDQSSTFNMETIDLAPEKDPVLEARDMIVVPRRFF